MIELELELVYKLRHIKTGLFFDPKGYIGNVSELGKVYSGRKPPRQNFISIPNDIKDKYCCEYKTEHSDWEVVKYELKEIKNNDNQ